MNRNRVIRLPDALMDDLDRIARQGTPERPAITRSELIRWILSMWVAQEVAPHD